MEKLNCRKYFDYDVGVVGCTEVLSGDHTLHLSEGEGDPVVCEKESRRHWRPLRRDDLDRCSLDEACFLAKAAKSM